MRDLDARLAKGLRAFNHYNRYKKAIMVENDPAGARVIVRFLPLCIHVNHPDLPGYPGDTDIPCGIKAMQWPAKTIEGLGEFLPSRIDRRRLQDYVPRQREIEGIFTIGSVGSVGQTRRSDYDIWVVVDEGVVGKSRIIPLKRKLQLLEKWLSSRYLLDVHFFIMDIYDIKSNNFGRVSHEGAGAALKNLLKEEFYRTMTLLEGRIPLWWIVPSDEKADVYDDSFQALHYSDLLEPDDFIDMGDIRSVPQQELLGAALWQMHKALDDPLKSVLKMALVSTYIEKDNEGELLCDVVRRRVLDSKKTDVVDSYIEPFRSVEAYYATKGEKETVDLLRRCFYLKVSPNIQIRDLIKIKQMDKASIMVEMVRSWGWSFKEIKDLNRFNEWDIERYRTLGDQLHGYLKKTAILLIRQSKASLLHVSMEEDVEMEILRRRVEAFYVSKKAKIKSEPRVKKNEPVFGELSFVFELGLWHIFRRYTPKSHPVMSTARVVKIIAWLVFNMRVDPSTAFHMIPNTSGVSLGDIQSLTKELYSRIPRTSAIGLNRDALMETAKITNIVAVLNMEKPEQINTISEIDVLYVNSWNELFCIHPGTAEFRQWARKVKGPETSLSLWMPDRSDSKRLAGALVSLLGS
ncbi:MAG: class I adenylate cyclase [Thermodesulfobacteriota bacterium]|nr:class I adenylate cyclase [Thermodesulfobacteriota bacterium]